ncbi:hypothetical protein LZ32DRAFT_51555 [Colletotrichum eremochloae]|nr:hypothetical protein LZ32DRAFT_51555 [Colletotrichum eremochloae]
MVDGWHVDFLTLLGIIYPLLLQWCWCTINCGNGVRSIFFPFSPLFLFLFFTVAVRTEETNKRRTARSDACWYILPLSLFAPLSLAVLHTSHPSSWSSSSSSSTSLDSYGGWGSLTSPGRC